MERKIFYACVVRVMQVVCSINQSIILPELLLGRDVLGLLIGRIGHLGESLGALPHHVVQHLLVLEEVGQDDPPVDDRGALQRGHAPQEEDALDQPVEGHPTHQDVGEELQHGEEREHHPVHQPLGVVVLGLALQGLDGRVRRVQEADEVAEQLRPVAEHQPQGDHGHHA